MEPVIQAEWDAFFAGDHHELWDYIGARTEYSGATPAPGTITYGGRYAGAVVTDILWSAPEPSLDMPYSEYDQARFYIIDPFFDLVNDDGSGSSAGNLTVGSWPAVGDDLIEGTHEEDLFFVHETFVILYDLYGHSAFDPGRDYLQDEFYNGLDYDAAEVFYHHLWRRKAHNDGDLLMTGVSWANSQSSWDEVIVMPDIFDAHPSPIQVAEGCWQLALDYYLGQGGRPQDKGLSLYFLGRVAHLLADLTVPAHAHCDPHSPVWPDSYENFMGAVGVYSQYTHNEVPVFDADGAVIGARPWGYTDQTWPYNEFSYVRYDIPGTKWDPFEPNDDTARAKWESQSPLFHLFWATAELADNYDSNDANGELDGGARRAGGFSEFELRQIADELMPQAMISLDELYRLFFYTIEQSVPAVHLLFPADGSILTSPPTFMWTSTGLGAAPVYAVDSSFSQSFTSYRSTYEDLGLLITDTSWTMPLGVWNRIPSGGQIYWRVRGADLSQPPVEAIVSDEIWSFTKQ
jgi:hypothetical protein